MEETTSYRFIADIICEGGELGLSDFTRLAVDCSAERTQKVRWFFPARFLITD